MVVEVYGGINAVSCGWGGGPHTGSVGAELEAAVEGIASKLKIDFSFPIVIKYIDTSNKLGEYPEVSKVALAGYSFPITMLNGEARLAGDLIYDDLKELIEEEMEA